MSDETPAPDRAAIRAFLELAQPGGPWVVTAIWPEKSEKRPTETKTYFDADAAAGWAETQNLAGWNVYWTVNRLRGAHRRKPRKEDVYEALFLHVDVDPRKGHDVATERARIFAELNAYQPLPTIIVDSGGGYQGLWRLDEPHFIGGTAERWEEVEAYSRQLGIDLGGDNTWNIERILRVAGTVNWPDSEKVKKGRVARRAEVEGGSGEAYPLAAFTPAPVQRATGAGSAVSLPSNLPRLKDLNELPEAVTPRTRMLIVQGDDPDDVTKYGSKSEVMWAVTCELVRAGCPDEQIAAVLLDPDLGISDHPLRQKRSVEYVARQIERAREEVAEPMLAKLNAEHAVIEMYGGKCRVVSWRPGEVDPDRLELVHQSFEDFRNRYMNVRVEVGKTKEGNPVYSPAGRWWLEHPMRSQYKSLVFRPNAPTEMAGELNLWRGLSVAPRSGDWPQLRRLIEEVLAAGDPAFADYIIRWAAFAVQYPERPAEVALVLRGGKGTGKSTFGHVMRRIFGQHGTSIASSHVMTNNFNKLLHDCCLLFADEALARGDAKAEGMIKALITEPTILIEPKNVDAFPAPNRLKVIIASNDDWVVSASADERRFAVFDVSPHMAAPPGSSSTDERVTWWRALHAEIDGGGLEAFLHDLLDLDLGDWHPRYDVPQNDALIGQKAASLSGLERVLYDMLCAGTVPRDLRVTLLSDDSFVVPTEELQKYSRGLAKRFDPTANAIANLLGAGQRVKGGSIPKPGMDFEKREYPRPKGWVFPPLGWARERWDKTRWPGDWDEATGWSLDYSDDAGGGPRGYDDGHVPF